MKSIFLTIGLLLLAGCASVPANFGKPPVASNIGVVLLIDETPTFMHVGTTIFNNENLDSASETKFSKMFGDQISEILSSGGHTPKIIEPTSLLVKERESLFSYMSSNINFKDLIKSELNQLAQKNELEYVVIVYPNSGPAWPNSSAYLAGYGLYTRCVFGSCNAYALDYVGARIFDVKNNSSLKPMEFRFFQQEEVPSIVVPEDVNQIPSEDIDKAALVAKDKIINLIEKMLRTSEFI
ncbi:MAG: hypothetical protein ACI9O6_003399 [Glaciecola sp.]|jgi:hypothetical protein